MNLKKYYNDLGISGISGLYSISGDFGIFDGLKSDIERINFTESNNSISIKSTGLDFEVQSNFEIEENNTYIRKDVFINTSNKKIVLNKFFSRFALDGGEYEVYLQHNGWQNESLGGWQPLIASVCAKNRGLRTTEGTTPFAAIWNKQTRKGVVFHLVPNSQWEINITKASALKSNYIIIDMGITDSALSLEVQPNESIKMPVIIFYEFENRLDLDCYKIHYLYNKMYPRRQMPIIYNTWLLNFDVIDIDLIKAQIETAAELGLEYFVLDAGWFGKGEHWDECIGDWEENLTGGYYGRMKEISNFVKDHNLKFGLWIEPERALKNAPSVKEHPEYFMSNNGYSYFLDFSNDMARKYIEEVIFKLIDKYNIDFIKFDFNDGISYDVSRNGFYRYHIGHAEFIKNVKEKYPNIYLECCGSGGMCMELGRLAEYDSFWFSDNQSPYDGLRIYKDTILRMPPSSIGKWVALKCVDDFTPEHCTDNTTRLIACNNATWDSVAGVKIEFLFAFLSGGPVGLSCNIDDFSEEFKSDCKEFIKQYKTERKFWMNCTCRILSDTDSVLILQYSDFELNKNKVVIFIKKMFQDMIAFFPKLSADVMYKINGDVKSGREFMNDGVLVKRKCKYYAIDDYAEILDIVEEK